MLTRLVALALVASPAFGADYDPAPAKAFCAQKWGGQYDMIAYCMEKQQDGWTEYMRIKGRAGGLDSFRPALEHCERKWPSQWDMVNYCAQKNIEGLRVYVETLRSLPAPVMAQIAQICEEKWQPQFDMIGYCAEQQATAWRAINQ